MSQIGEVLNAIIPPILVYILGYWLGRNKGYAIGYDAGVENVLKTMKDINAKLKAEAADDL